MIEFPAQVFGVEHILVHLVAHLSLYYRSKPGIPTVCNKIQLSHPGPKVRGALCAHFAENWMLSNHKLSVEIKK